MMDSMVKNARPTRQEASDVSNGVLDGVDAMVLDCETYSGDYPINAVSMLCKCTVEAEKTIDWRKTFNDLKLYSPAPYGTAESVACAAVASVLDLKVDLIVVLTETGKLARLVAKYKPEVAIICCSPNESVVQHMNLQRGVLGVYAKETLEIDAQISIALAEAKKQKFAKIG
jgi:pyruvate kinase